MSDINLHTCDKTAAGWHKTGDCKECARVESQRKLLISIGEPARNPFEDFEYRMSERAERISKDAQS